MRYRNNYTIVSVQWITDMHVLTMVIPHGILEKVAFSRASQHSKILLAFSVGFFFVWFPHLPLPSSAIINCILRVS